MKRAFTLIEVTLAMGVLAGGILTIVSLYGFGYSESNQSREDVAATAVAEYVLSQLTAAVSATNVTWAAFNGLQSSYPNNLWGAYVKSDNPSEKAGGVFQKVIEKLGGSGYSFPGEDFTPMKLHYGLVVMHEAGSPIVRFAFRAVRQPQQLLAAPQFYGEAIFQGVTTETKK